MVEPQPPISREANLSRRIPVLSLLITLAAAGPARAEPLIAESLISDEQVAAAQDEYADATAFRATLYWENDGSLLKPNDNDDRWYTNGTGLNFAIRNNSVSREIGSWIPWGDYDPANTAVGFAPSLSMFTAEDLAQFSLQVNDRPYAGYWAFAFYFQRSTGDEVCATFEHIQIDFGFVGTHTAADDIQRKIHSTFAEQRPNGWHNQLTDEFTAQLYLRKKWRFRVAQFELNDIPPMTVQVIPAATLAIGTVYRHFELNATLRIGFNLPDDFGPDRLADFGSFTTAGAQDGWGFYMFTRVGGRAVEHNLFIDGSDFNNGHGVRSHEVLGELGAGFAVHYRNGDFSLDFTYGQIFLTKEFYGQLKSPHSYGHVALTGTWRF